LGVELPMLLTYLYYEGYKPSGKPFKYSIEKLLAHVSIAFQDDPQIGPDATILSSPPN